MTEARRNGVAKAIPMSLAVGAYALSYGVLAVAAGLPPWLATASSVIVLAGGSQFLFVGVLAAGGSPMTGALGGLLLNLRLVPFGVAIARHLPPSRWRQRLADSYIVIDESVALALTAPRDEVAVRYRIVGWAITATWIGGTALGAYGGALLGDPERFGLDAAFPAGFLALLAPWLRSRQGQVAAVLGIVILVALTPIAPAGLPVVAAGLGALVALRLVPAPPPPTSPVSGSTDPNGVVDHAGAGAQTVSKREGTR